jgi:hypothetical protein
VEQAKEMLKQTTQRVIGLAVFPSARQLCADRMFQTKQLAGMWVSNTMDGCAKSLDSNQYAQVFSNGVFSFSALSKQMQDLHKKCIMEVGVPEDLTIDQSKEHNSPGIDLMKICR